MKNKHSRILSLFFIALCFTFIGFTNVQASSATLNLEDYYQMPIISSAKTTSSALESWAKSKGATPTFISLAKLYFQLSPEQGGVNPVIAYAQAAKETNFGKFTSGPTVDFNNPCGIRDSSGAGYAKFSSWEQGIRAHLDHLALYAGAAGYPRKDTFDPRHFSFIAGKATTIASLGGTWSSLGDYGKDIASNVKEIYTSFAANPLIENINTDKPSPQVVNSDINITVEAYGSNLLYRFWIHDGYSWKVVKDYSSSNSFKWTPTKVANHKIWVDIKSSSSKNDVDTYKEISYNVVNKPTIKALYTSLPSPQSPGNTIKVTAEGTGGVNPLYRFWINDGVTWKVVKDYSKENFYNWNPEATGGHFIWVDIKDSASKNDSDGYKEIYYYISSGIKAINTSKPSPQVRNSTINITADALGSKLLYRFWIHDGATWKIVKGYSSSNSYSWTPTKAGDYRIWVDIKSSNSYNDVDAYKEITYSIKDLPIIKSITTSSPSPQSAGNTIKVTGNGSGGVEALYRFWIKDNGVWKVVKDYSKDNTYNWTQQAAGNYIIWVDIKDKNSSNSYDDYKEIPYVVTLPKLVFNTDKASPQNINTSINMVATSSDTNSLYRFWVYDGVAWKIVKEYSKSNSYLWTPTKAGSYRLWVDAKNENSILDRDDYKELYYEVGNSKRTIVIDPGHNYGGDDGAYATHKGTVYSERDLNMELGIKLKKYLEAYGYNVVLTRQPGEILKDDLKTSLQKRVDIANNLKADLFLSLHHDISGNASTTGLSAHYSSYRPTIDNEGVVSGSDPGGWSYSNLLIDSTPSPEARISMELANKLLEGLTSSLGYNNLKAHDHALFVTRNIDVPSILLESGFLSNEAEAARSAKAEEQEAKTKKIAEIIYQYFK